MKKDLLTILSLLLGGFLASTTIGHAQGSLTPPGAPGPTMKTLAQIEPRAAITNTGAVTISQPGSYYLTTNITVSSGDAITIATNNVTLNLNGFTVSSTAPSAAGNGIMLAGSCTNVTILNGFIMGGVTNSAGVYGGSGFANGINYASGAYNVRVSGVSVSGCLNNGINLVYNSTVVESCTVNMVGGYGIIAMTVNDSTAINCGNSGIYCQTANNCYGYGYAGYGIRSYASINNCYGYSITGDGLTAGSVHNGSGYSSSGIGVYATAVENTTGTSTSYYGIYTTVANNSYGYSSSGTGLYSTVATGCYANTESISYKYNMP